MVGVESFCGQRLPDTLGAPWLRDFPSDPNSH